MEKNKKSFPCIVHEERKQEVALAKTEFFRAFYAPMTASNGRGCNTTTTPTSTRDKSAKRRSPTLSTLLSENPY